MYHSGDQMWEDEVDRAYGTYGEKRKWLVNLKERDHMQELGLDRCIILKEVKQKIWLPDSKFD